MTPDELIEQQVSKGVAVSSVDDGTLIFLSVEAMRKLIAAAQAKGSDRVVVFAKKERPS